MALPVSRPKISDTTNYSGTLPPQPFDNGTTQCGAFASNPTQFMVDDVLEGLPAAVRVQLTKNNGIVQTGSLQQYGVKLSKGNTLQLTPLMANAQNQVVSAVAPNVFTYKFTSRNVHVATVDANGLVTAVNRGETEITIQSSRQVNASFAGGNPSGTEGVQCSLNVTVIA